MSRSPDFILKALNKATDERSGKLGCAWQNEDGSLTVALDMCVTLSANPSLVLTLFPNTPAPAPAFPPTKAMPTKVRKPRKNTMAALPVSVHHRMGGA